jgi:hypothetical protein
MDDLRIEARNDARALKAVRDQQIPEINPKIPKPKRFYPTMDTFNATTDYVASLDLRDNALEAQMAKISTNAIQDKLGWKPSTIKSDVTKEMILDYQEEMRKPIIIDGVKYNYHPSTVDIDPIVYEPVLQEYTENELAQFQKEKENAIKRLKDISLELRKIEQHVERVRKYYDRESSLSVDETEYRYLQIKFDQTMEEEERNRRKLLSEINMLESRIDAVNTLIITNARAKRENDAEKTRVAKENASRLKLYKEDLNQLNKGRLNVEQQPNESDDDFRNRLRDTGMMTYDEDAMYKSAELYNREKMKERMIEIHRDTAMTGNALKSFDADQLFKMNKNWSTLKQNFIKIYGFNSPAVRDRDIVSFFTSQINPIVNAQNSGDLYPVDFLSGEVPEATAVVLEEEPLPTPLLRSEPAEAVQFPVPPTNPFPYLTLEQAEQMKVPELQAYVDEVAPKLSKDFKIYSKGQKAKVQFLIDNSLIIPSKGTIESYLRPIASNSGEGLKGITHDLPNKIQFGKIFISPKKLYYDNVLAIRHKSGKSFTGVPNTSVSDKFVSIIMNLLKGQKPSLKDFSSLDLNEKGLYDSLIYMAGLQKEVDNTFHDTKNHLKNRLELIEGEIGAGNNNPKLKKELLYLLSKMVKTGMVGGGDAKRYYQSICK